MGLDFSSRNEFVREDAFLPEVDETMTSAKWDAARIDEDLVRALLDEQAPQWQDLSLRRAPVLSNDHRIFRLGDDLSVRLPNAPRCVPQVEKEHVWLPRLDGSLPVRVPRVVMAGRPSALFAAPWSVYDWIPGEPGAFDPSRPERLAVDLARFLVALRGVDAAGGPGPGEQTAFRGAPLAHGDDEMRSILNRVTGRERDLGVGIWRDALEARFTGSPVWFHGDVSMNNLLFEGGRLSAVIDFGCAGVGDPACDTVIRWTVFRGAARERFRVEYDVDEATWARGRGWALWKGLIMLTNTPPGQAAFGRRVLDELFADR